MTTQTDENTVTFQDPANGKAAVVFTNDLHVVFGWMDGAEFRVSYNKTSRFYKTRKGAHNAAVKWVYK